METKEKKTIRYVDTKIMYGHDAVLLISVFEDKDGKLYSTQTEIDEIVKDMIIKNLASRMHSEEMEGKGYDVR